MTTRTPISMDDLEAALDWSSAGGAFENQAFIDRATGELHFQSLHGDFEDELPEDLDDGTRYIVMPHKHDFDLGRALVFDFVDVEAPHLAEPVHATFRRKGAYGRFKTILERAGMLERWYAFEKAATHAALRRWAEENGFVVLDGKHA